MEGTAHPRPAPSTTHVVLLHLSVLLLAGFAPAQPPDCARQPLNVLRFENCGFASGIAGWSPVAGAHETSNPDEGNPSPGSFQIESVDDDEGDRAIAIASPCVPIAPSSTYQVESQLKIADPSDAVQCGLFVAGYSTDLCSGSPNGEDSAEIRVTGPTWTSLAQTHTSRSVDASMKIYVFCYEDASGPTFTMLLDNFIAEGPALGSPVFSDGFETGDTSAWSKIVP